MIGSEPMSPSPRSSMDSDNSGYLARGNNSRQGSNPSNPSEFSSRPASLRSNTSRRSQLSTYSNEPVNDPLRSTRRPSSLLDNPLPSLSSGLGEMQLHSRRSIDTSSDGLSNTRRQSRGSGPRTSRVSGLSNSDTPFGSGYSSAGFNPGPSGPLGSVPSGYSSSSTLPPLAGSQFGRGRRSFDYSEPGNGYQGSPSGSSFNRDSGRY